MSIFVPATGLVLAAIPASSLRSLPVTPVYPGLPSLLAVLHFAVPPARILATASCLFILPNIFGYF